MNTCEGCLALARELAGYYGGEKTLQQRMLQFIAEHTPRASGASGRADQGGCIFPLNAVPNESGATVQTSGLATPSADATAGPYTVMPISLSKGPRVFSVFDSTRIDPPLWTCGDPTQADAVCDVVNAAYRAGRDSMREPTEAMIAAGAAKIRVLRPVGGLQDARAVWDAMQKAREALEFYAHEAWCDEDNGEPDAPATMKWRCAADELHEDQGARARAALKEIDDA